jgi:hypothetical protein
MNGCFRVWKLMVFVLLLGGFILPVSAQAGVEYNGHYYELSTVAMPSWCPDSTDWETAALWATQVEYNGMPGYLATLTSAAENEAILPLIDIFWSHSGIWIGGFQPDNLNADSGATPSSDWKWVSGEPWGYTNWQPGYPKDGPGWTEAPPYIENNAANRLMLLADGTWADHSVGDIAGNRFLVEYSPVGGSTVTPEPVSCLLFLLGAGAFVGTKKLRKS